MMLTPIIARVLRCLCSIHIFRQIRTDRFANNRISAALRNNEPLRAYVQLLYALIPPFPYHSHPDMETAISTSTPHLTSSPSICLARRVPHTKCTRQHGKRPWALQRHGGTGWLNGFLSTRCDQRRLHTPDCRISGTCNPVQTASTRVLSWIILDWRWLAEGKFRGRRMHTVLDPPNLT